MDQWYVWRRKNEAHAVYSEAWQWLLCFFWHWITASRGGQQGFNQVSENPRRKLKLGHHWTLQQYHPKRTSHRGLVSEDKKILD